MSKPGADEQGAAVEQKMLSLWRVVISNHHEANVGRTYYLYGPDRGDVMQQAQALEVCHPDATTIEFRPVRHGVRIGHLLIPESISEQEYKRVPSVKEAYRHLAAINEKQALLDSMEDPKSVEAVKLDSQITDMVFWLFERGMDITIQPDNSWGFGK